MTAPTQIQVPAGMCCITTYGSVTGQTAQSWSELRSHSEKQGLVNVAWAIVPGTLVEKARNDAVRQMLGLFQGQAQWLLMVDGDMTFAPDALHRLLMTAYGSHPWADAVGAYCQLRGEPFLPTIDTGTGTWESIYPGSGVREVMRTGAAFLLVKRHVFERIPQPWFRVRQPMRFLDAFAEIDNFARIKMDGKNPFRGLPGKPWETLEQMAASDPQSAPGGHAHVEVGEDSGFCDRVKNAGFRIVVDTGIEIGHLDQKTITWKDHRDAMRRHQNQWLQAVGVA